MIDELAMRYIWSVLMMAYMCVCSAHGRNYVDDRGAAPRHMGHLW
jgi:hypothetical protein